VLVVEDAVVNIGVDNAEVCIGGAVELTAAVSGGSSIFTYQWQDSLSGGSWAAIGGATDMTYSAPTVVAGLTWYRVVITDTNSGCSDPVSADLLVTVVEDATVDVSVNNAEVCIDGDATLTANVSGGSSVFTYQWESSMDNASWSPVIGATNMTYNAPTNAVGVRYYRVQITDTNSDCSDPLSSSVSVTVVADALVNIGVDNAEVCIGGAALLTASVSGGSSGLTWYRVVITDENSGCSDPISTSVSVLVVEDATVDVSVDNAEVCIGGSAILSAAVSGGSSVFTYQWQDSLSGGSWAAIGGATEMTYSAPTAVSGLTWYRVVITDTNSDCSDPVSTAVLVTVVEDATVAVSVDNAEVCIDGSAILSAAVSGGSSVFTYQWQDSLSGGSWAVIGGATEMTYSAPTAVSGLAWYRVVITDTNSDCSDPVSTAVLVTVVEDAVVDVSVDNAEVCIGGSAILNAAVSGGSSVFTYQWQDSLSGGSWAVIGGATEMTYSAPTAVSGLTWYRVVITDTNSGCSDPISTAVLVTVVEDAVVDVSVDNAEVCIGGSAILSAAVSGGSSVFTYQWQDSLSGGSWAVIGGATDMTYSAPTAVSGLTWYRVVITDTNSGCSDPVSTAVLVTVVEDAVVDVSVDNAEVCIGGSANLPVAG
jgi:zinc transporter ZupT